MNDVTVQLVHENHNAEWSVEISGVHDDIGNRLKGGCRWLSCLVWCAGGWFWHCIDSVVRFVHRFVWGGCIRTVDCRYRVVWKWEGTFGRQNIYIFADRFCGRIWLGCFGDKTGIFYVHWQKIAESLTWQCLQRFLPTQMSIKPNCQKPGHQNACLKIVQPEVPIRQAFFRQASAKIRKFDYESKIDFFTCSA